MKGIISVFNAKLTPRQIERFWKKVNKSEECNCWEWNRPLGTGGYGCFSFFKISIKAHRVSWIIHHGPIPEKLLVLHKCDNRKCVNPNHLFLGTHQDNSDDCISKNRQASGIRSYSTRHPEKFRGENSGMAKLTNEKVIKIRELYAKKSMTVRAIGKMFGVSHSSIVNICKRRLWTHIK